MASPYTIENPVGVDNLQELLAKIASAIVDIAIPIAVIMYVYAGILYLSAGTNAGNVNRAKEILWYTSIGLAVIFIGGGFVDLIRSIINAGA